MTEINDDDIVLDEPYHYSFFNFREKCPKCGNDWHGLANYKVHPPCPGPFNETVIVKGVD